MSSYLSYFYSYHHAVCWDKNECLGTDTHVERMDGWMEGGNDLVAALLLVCCARVRHEPRLLLCLLAIDGDHAIGVPCINSSNTLTR